MLAPLWALRSPSAGYMFTDPSRFEGYWAQDALLEARNPAGECFCEDTHEPGLVSWSAFQAELLGNLSEDPSFRGPWVHALCGEAYPAIFRLAAMDPQTGQVAMQGSCSAGLLAMTVVCAQSLALHSRQPPLGAPAGSGGAGRRWEGLERVVVDEGEAVGDVFKPMELQECLSLCENHERCGSVAHGPFGCHLKGRCVSAASELAAQGVAAAGYRTYYRSPCYVDDSDAASADDGSAGLDDDLLRSPPSSRTHEVRLMLDLSVRLLERAVHCLEKSEWPFKLHEVLDNRIEFIEAGLQPGNSAWSEGFRWSRFPTSMLLPRGSLDLAAAGDALLERMSSMEQEQPGGAAYPVRRQLDRLLIRWARGLDGEVGFWHALLDDQAEDVAEEDAARGRHWLRTGEVHWSWDEDAICNAVNETRSSSSVRFGAPRVLNAGSGPLAPAPLTCADGHAMPVVSADGLARFYLRVFDLLGLQPPRTALQCPAEALRRCFPANHFDVVHIRNALDHAADPLLGLQQMLEVVRPGGWVLLRHARNEGVAGHFQFGLHQWAFDAVRGPASAEGGEHGPDWRFVIWNPALRADVTAWLLGQGMADRVLTQLRPHPGGDPDTEYVWVDIRKPVA